MNGYATSRAVRCRSLTAEACGAIHVGFVVDKVALELFPLLQFWSVSIIPQMLHDHLHTHAVLTRRTKGRSVRLPKSTDLAEIGRHFREKGFNLLKPNDPYMGRTAPLTSKRCILYIYSTNISTEYFKHALYSPFFSLQNAVYFIMLTCLVSVLFTFDIQGVLKLKK